ncbi:MAG TPA: hypothetical protein ACFYEK_07005 [Candidatus Wunengus sp. YC60]|uniref:hypothetical protein n=1 Tax=Candidatus Wunengus sp. YC60 TaxID=3367697 RepID=UPI004029FA5C
MIRRLPTFKGYTVDMRLHEFRKVPLNQLPEFIPFDSERGQKLIMGFLETPEGKREYNYTQLN